MRTYEQIMADARDGQAFSNSDEGYDWMDRWCGPCVNDDENRLHQGGGCPLILASLMHKKPVEWLEQPADTPDRWHCIEHRGPDDGPGEPQPIPDPPGQPGLFPREPHEGVRMYADSVPKTVEVS